MSMSWRKADLFFNLFFSIRIRYVRSLPSVQLDTVSTTLRESVKIEAFLMPLSKMQSITQMMAIHSAEKIEK